MIPSLSRPELRELFTRFMFAVQANGPIRRLSGCGIVEAFAIHDPDWRVVMDTREPGTPDKAFALHIDDPNAPEPHVEVFIGGETLDKAFCGELHVRSALAAGLIRFEGDQPWAIRLIPVLMDVVPFYRSMRAKFAQERYGSPD